jgi:uncharacterized protein (DUF58 family)
MQGISVTLEELLALRHMAGQICLPQPKTSRSAQLGGYRSPFRGRGMDFVENRVYQPGDDIRAINWAVTARTGKTHTKVYQQERECPVYIILDYNDSMFFGTRTAFKSVIATQAAALIAWAALKNGDRVGALLVKGSAQILPPCHSKQNLVELLKSMVNHVAPESQGPVDLAGAINKLKRTIKSGSLIYFLSDFYNLDEKLQQEMQHLAKHHEVTNVLIYDPIEKEPPEGGRYLFHDFNQSQSVLLDTHSKEICNRYSAIFIERLMKLKKISYATGMHLIELATNDDLAKTMRQVLQRKVR